MTIEAKYLQNPSIETIELVPKINEDDRPLLNQIADFLEPGEYDTTYLTHGLHTYPAKYIPQLPRLIIESHTNERNTVFDPFCGSGTTLLEASIRGRYSIGVDSNPIASLISRAKTQTLTEPELKEIIQFKERIESRTYPIPNTPIPDVPNIDHWFQPNMKRELAWIKSEIDKLSNQSVKQFLQAIFSSIIVSVSNQESDTRYASINKNLSDGYALNRFSKKILSSFPSIVELSSIDAAIKNTPQIHTLDARNITENIIPDHSIDLIVTSPPYPNSYDYYLYHKFRLSWLGYDHKVVQGKEIGSRHEHSSKKEPVETFIKKMVPVMKNVARTLKPSKLAYFFVGDSIISGELINMTETYQRICKDLNLKFLEEVDYSLSNVSRMFHEKRLSANKNKKEKKQRVLVFEGQSTKGKNQVGGPRKKAIPKSEKEAISLEGEIEDGSKIALKSDNKNRHVHSLGRYPAKFIPEIPKWALNQFAVKGDTILDPFAGSGTTAVESLLYGNNVISSDISSYACLLAKAKTTFIDDKYLEKSTSDLKRVLHSPSLLPDEKRMEFPRDSFWFDLDHLKLFERIKKYIQTEIKEEVQPFYLAILSTTIKKFSYQDESQIKVKRDAKKLLRGTPKPNDLMLSKLDKYVDALKDFMNMTNSSLTHKIFNLSADKINSDVVGKNGVDVIITSPPYINAMNYFMASRYENFLLDLTLPNKKIDHEKEYFGTERVYAENYSTLHLLDEKLNYSSTLNPKFKTIFEREPKRAYITYLFFKKMSDTFQSLSRILKPGGKFILVAGTNRIRNVPINTFDFLVQDLNNHGLKTDYKFHYDIVKQSFKLTRHKTADVIDMDGIAILEKSEL